MEPPDTAFEVTRVPVRELSPDILPHREAHAGSGRGYRGRQPEGGWAFPSNESLVRSPYLCPRRLPRSYAGASTITSASPVSTSVPSWFVTTVSSPTRLFSVSTLVAVTFAVSVSPAFTGARNRRFWLI